MLKWTLEKVERKFINRSQENGNAEPREDSNSSSNNNIGKDLTKDKHNKGHIVIPYTQGLGESIRKICRKYGIHTHFKGTETIKEILVKPKDNDPLDRRSGTIHWYQCGEFTCDEEYIGETSMTFGERYKEHPKEPLPIYGHSNITGHSTNPDNITFIGREDHGLARTIKESIYIRVNNPYSIGMWVSIIFIIYGTESCLIPLNLKSVMTMDMQTEHPSVGMLSLFQPIGMHIEQ